MRFLVLMSSWKTVNFSGKEIPMRNGTYIFGKYLTVSALHCFLVVDGRYI